MKADDFPEKRKIKWPGLVIGNYYMPMAVGERKNVIND
jgi:hypothetical protein